MVLRLPVLGGAQIMAFAGLIETTGFFQASSTDGHGPREGQFSMKDSTETGEPGNYGVGSPNVLGQGWGPWGSQEQASSRVGQWTTCHDGD